MEYIFIAALVVVVLVVIAYPLVNGARSDAASTPNALDSLIAQRDSAYDALRDLDFDFQMGKLSQGDYTALRDKYMGRAALALQQIDAALGADGAAARIEEEVARLRQLRAGAARADRPAPPADGDDIERQVRRLRERKLVPEAAGADRHAPAHDTNGDDIEQEIVRLRSSKLRCPHCRASYQAGDQFCSKCGHKL